MACGYVSVYKGSESNVWYYNGSVLCGDQADSISSMIFEGTKIKYISLKLPSEPINSIIHIILQIHLTTNYTFIIRFRQNGIAGKINFFFYGNAFAYVHLISTSAVLYNNLVLIILFISHLIIIKNLKKIIYSFCNLIKTASQVTKKNLMGK